jgi:hypothetical protein
MLCVDVSPAPNHRGGHHAVKNTLKHHALNAQHIRRARLVRLASLAPFALRFRFLIPLSTATFTQNQKKAHATVRSVRFIRQNASRFGITPRRFAFPHFGQASPSRTAFS